MSERSFPSDQSNIEPIFRLLAVFQTHEELQFPGVSAQTLTAAMAGIDEQIDELARLEDALVEARAALSARRQGLMGLARQAHAYATIFAQAPGASETDSKREELRQQLAAINLNESESSTEKAGRKRRMKPAHVSTVPSESAVSSESAVPSERAVSSEGSVSSDDSVLPPEVSEQKDTGHAASVKASVAELDAVEELDAAELDADMKPATSKASGRTHSVKATASLFKAAE